MALKTPLKLKNTPQPHRAFPPLPVMKPLSSATPKAPTGQVERWLVIHKRTGGVLGVAWDHYWFGARARAEWYYKVPLDALTLRHMPLLQVEKDAQCNMSGEQLVKALGLKMHTEVVVQDVDHAEGTITLGRGCGMTFSFNDESGEAIREWQAHVLAGRDRGLTVGERKKEDGGHGERTDDKR